MKYKIDNVQSVNKTSIIFSMTMTIKGITQNEKIIAKYEAV